ncbi:MAG: ATP-binding cassette domain-containing protein [Clostridia bacterium]|nr:ATP-binding cassette domain-containing protein [Clostridia bacterium]
MVNTENKPVDGSMSVSVSEAGKILKNSGNKISNNEVDAFVSLKDINKIYPNGVQAVYDFNIDISENDFIVLVGPSGCGKSTTLRMIAGLEEITSGYLYIDKVLSNYTSSKDRDISMVFQNYALYPQMTVFDNIAFPLRARKFRRPMEATAVKAWNQVIDIIDKRAEELTDAQKKAKDKALNYGTVVEYIATKLKICDEAAKILCKYNIERVEDLKKSVKGVPLYDVIKNTAESNIEAETKKISAKGYGIDEEYRLTMDGKIQYHYVKMSKEEIRSRVFEAAEILDLGSYLDRRPKELSGGQMQRVALGRAIVRNAKLFLMDEPLSNLDAKLRVQMRSEIVRIHEQIGATTIYVTHDQTEAMTMATKIVVMSKGWVQQIGTPQEIYHNPNNIFVATFIGSPAMNIFDAEYDNGKLVFSNGYQVSLSDEFVSRHNRYYEAKIKELNRMLNTDDFKKMHALRVLDKVIYGQNDKSSLSALDSVFDEIIEITADIACGEEIKGLIADLRASNKDKSVKIDKKALLKIREPLMTFEKIPSADIGMLHNAQVFSKEEIVVDNTLYYQKPKKDKKKKKPTVNLNSTDIEFVNNLYEVAQSLLAKCENALTTGKHPIRVGVRPEDIVLDAEFTGNKTDKFVANANIVELLGSELLVHSDWADTSIIAKISTNVLIKPHTDVELAFNKDKILLFDESCGDRI